MGTSKPCPVYPRLLRICAGQQNDKVGDQNGFELDYPAAWNVAGKRSEVSYMVPRSDDMTIADRVTGRPADHKASRRVHPKQPTCGGGEQALPGRTDVYGRCFRATAIELRPLGVSSHPSIQAQGGRLSPPRALLIQPRIHATNAADVGAGSGDVRKVLDVRGEIDALCGVIRRNAIVF
jgi:hypothetical protein